MTIDKSFKKIQVFPTSLEILLTTISNEINEHIPRRSSVKPSDAEMLAHVFDKTRYPVHYKAPAPAHCWNCKKVTNSDSEFKLMRCARCMTAVYCDKTCQTNHWTTSHKYCCKSYPIYSCMISEIKQSLDNMTKYLYEFVSTDDDDDDEEKEKTR